MRLSIFSDSPECVDDYTSKVGEEDVSGRDFSREATLTNTRVPRSEENVDSSSKNGKNDSQEPSSEGIHKHIDIVGVADRRSNFDLGVDSKIRVSQMNMLTSKSRTTKKKNLRMENHP